MFTVGEEDFKDNLVCFRLYNRQVYLNTFLIFSSMMIEKMLKSWKKLQLFRLRVVHIILLLSITKTKFIVGDKQDTVKLAVAKRPNNLFLKKFLFKLMYKLSYLGSF